MTDKTPIPDGGPAFPQNDATVNRINNMDGMSLRDYFAAAALTGCTQFACQHTADFCKHASSLGLKEHQLLARLAYEVADAMLRAREAQ